MGSKIPPSVRAAPSSSCFGEGCPCHPLARSTEYEFSRTRLDVADWIHVARCATLKLIQDGGLDFFTLQRARVAQMRGSDQCRGQHPREGAKVNDADAVRLRANAQPTRPCCDVKRFRRTRPTCYGRSLQHRHDDKTVLHKTVEQKWLRMHLPHRRV